MEIYNYDENGFFLNESLADESPLEPGVFLIPAYSTTVKPLDYKEGFYIKFNSELNEFQYEEKHIEVNSVLNELLEEEKPIEAKEAANELSEEELAEQLQAQTNTEALNLLNSSDWKVIRALERLMLSGTELNLEREALRESIV